MVERAGDLHDAACGSGKNQGRTWKSEVGIMTFRDAFLGGNMILCLRTVDLFWEMRLLMETGRGLHFRGGEGGEGNHSRRGGEVVQREGEGHKLVAYVRWW